MFKLQNSIKSLKRWVDYNNDYLADLLSYSLSTMLTFWIVLLLVIVPLFYGAPKTVVGWAQYLCSVVFQGIALPVLGYTARKASDKSDKVINDMAEMLQKIESIVDEIHKEEGVIKEEVDEIAKYEKEDHIKN